MVRAALIVALCCGVAVVLQGCGSSGSSTSCLAPQLDIVSQSVSGTMSESVSVQLEMMNTTVTTTMTIQNTQFTEKLDLEQFNLYFEEAMDQKIDTPMMHMDVHSETKGMVIASEKKVVGYAKLINKTDGRVLMENCTVMTVEQMPAPLVLSALFKEAILKMRALTSCGGNDGTYDTWKIDKSFDVKQIPNVPGMPPVNISSASGSMSEKIVMTKDHLLHSTSGKVQAQAKSKEGQDASLDVTVDMKVTDAKAGGPSDADLDYSTWDCKKATQEANLDELFDAFIGGVHVPQNFKQRAGSLKHHVVSTIKVAIAANAKAVEPVVV